MSKVPYVHSNFERVDGDYYPTIDKRCTYGFLQHFQPSGICVDVCAPMGSGIVDCLIEHGYNAVGIPDAFADNVKAQWIVTNPPYDRSLVDAIIYRQIERVKRREVYGLAVLLRSNFSYAKSRKAMFQDCIWYAGKIELLFRPWWTESRDAQPIHNYTWQIWTADASIPRVLFSDGVEPCKKTA